MSHPAQPKHHRADFVSLPSSAGGWEQQHSRSQVLHAQTPLGAPEPAGYPSDLLSDEVALLPVRSLTREVKAAELDLGLFQDKSLKSHSCFKRFYYEIFFFMCVFCVFVLLVAFVMQNVSHSALGLLSLCHYNF